MHIDSPHLHAIDYFEGMRGRHAPDVLEGAAPKVKERCDAVDLRRRVFDRLLPKQRARFVHGLERAHVGVPVP